MKIVLESWDLEEADKLMTAGALHEARTITKAAHLLGTSRGGVIRRIIKHKIVYPFPDTAPES